MNQKVLCDISSGKFWSVQETPFQTVTAVCRPVGSDSVLLLPECPTATGTSSVQPSKQPAGVELTSISSALLP
jgi:hypothetical protein